MKFKPKQIIPNGKTFLLIALSAALLSCTNELTNQRVVRCTIKVTFALGIVDTISFYTTDPPMFALNRGELYTTIVEGKQIRRSEAVASNVNTYKILLVE